MAAVGGKAAHSLIEFWDLEGGPSWSIEDWEDEASAVLDAEVSRTETESGIPMDEWRVSGRATKARPNKEDIEWWRAELPKMGQMYAEWREKTAWEIWITPDGELAVELEIKVPLPDVEVPFLGYIDRVFVEPDTGALVVWDAKFGSQSPEDLVQLSRYRMGLELRYGVQAQYGAIYKGRTGDLIPIFKDGKTLMPLSHLSSSIVAGDIEAQWRLIQTGAYPASPGRHCSWCDVRNSCTHAKGRDAWKHDPSHPGYKPSALTLAA